MRRLASSVFVAGVFSFAGTTLAPALCEAQPAPADDDEAEAPPAKPEPPSSTPEAKEAEPEAEAEAEEDEGVNISKAPAKGKGAIVGVITDTKFSEAVIEAQVSVIGRKEKTFTDTDGKFRLELPPGTYNIRVAYEMHRPTRVDRIKVEAGKLERIDAQLTPDESAVETVVIEEEADKTSLEGQSLERKRSAVVSDGVGRAEIAKTPDRNAAEAARRVVGASIVDGRFVYVRGLGERYTNALLNGTPLPSPEPDRQTVPLDLFPSLVLDSVTISKQFTPDMPADFAGGSVRIFTREFPRERLFQISITGGYNSEATFRDRLSYPGSKGDAFGFDSGVRALPGDIPKGKIDGSDPEQALTWGKRLNSFMSTRHKSTPPNHGFSLVAGDSFKLSGERKLGVLAALSYGRTYQIRENLLRNYTTTEGPAGKVGLRVADSFDGVQGIDSVRWGAFATLTYELNKHSKIGLTGLRSQSADDSASQLEGSFDGNPAIFHPIHLEYVSRALNFAQLRGTHDYPKLNRMQIDWSLALSDAVRNQPDTRDIRYLATDATDPRGAGYVWFPDLQSGFHYYARQSEQSVAGSLDITQPLNKNESQETKLKVGTLVTTRDRFSTARRFVYNPPRTQTEEFQNAAFCPGSTWQDRCADQLFRNRSVQNGLLNLREVTQRFDEYSAGLDVYAAYAMVDSQLSKRWRAIGGARIEATRQEFVAYDPFDKANTTLRSGITSTDVLPALSVVFAATDKTNARFGASQTIARPQLRETTPFLSSAYTAEYPIQGNPDLTLTKITNLDLRMEYFPTLRQVLAASVFFKHFKDPIETVIIPGAAPGILTYANVDAATLFGAELEARKDLGFITSLLDDFMLIGNLTLAKSDVKLGSNGGAATTKDRPMSFQSEYVVNVSLDYANDKSGTNIRALYNVFGPRIVEVGSSGIPDVYELPRHVVDVSVAQKLAKHFDLKLTVQNLLGAPVVLAHKGSTLYYRETRADGRAGRLFAHEDPTTRRFQPGTTVSLSAQYTY
jgi:TonB-dependent receptor